MRTMLLLLAFAAAAAVPSLAAQRPAAAGGVWYGAGVGAGWARVSCRICRGNSQGGTGGYVRLGGRVHSRLLVGAEAAAWFHGGNQVDESAWAFSAAAYWYPGRTGALLLKGGLGYTTHHADDGVDVVSTHALGPQIGAGYEFRAGRDWRIAPFVNASFGVMFGAVQFNGGTAAADGNATLVQIGIGVMRR